MVYHHVCHWHLPCGGKGHFKLHRRETFWNSRDVPIPSQLWVEVPSTTPSLWQLHLGSAYAVTSSDSNIPPWRVFDIGRLGCVCWFCWLRVLKHWPFEAAISHAEMILTREWPTASKDFCNVKMIKIYDKETWRKASRGWLTDDFLKTALMEKARHGRWGMTFTLPVGDDQLKVQTQRSKVPTKVRQGSKQVHPNTSTPHSQEVMMYFYVCFFIYFLDLFSVDSCRDLLLRSHPCSGIGSKLWTWEAQGFGQHSEAWSLINQIKALLKGPFKAPFVDSWDPRFACSTPRLQVVSWTKRRKWLGNPQGLVNVPFWGFVSHHQNKYLLEMKCAQ